MSGNRVLSDNNERYENGGLEKNLVWEINQNYSIFQKHQLNHTKATILIVFARMLDLFCHAKQSFAT